MSYRVTGTQKKPALCSKHWTESGPKLSPHAARPPPLLDEERSHAQRKRGQNMHTHHPRQDHMLTRGCRTLLMHMPVGITRIKSKILLLQPVSKQHGVG